MSTPPPRRTRDRTLVLVDKVDAGKDNVPESDKERGGQELGEDVGELSLRRNVSESDDTILDLLP